MHALQLDRFVEKIATMDRPSLVAMLRSMECDFDLDFTDEFLASVSLERLRHITVATSLRARNSSPDKPN